MDHYCGFNETLDELSKGLFEGNELRGGVLGEPRWRNRVGGGLGGETQAD